MKKLSILILMIMLIGLTSASLGTFKQSECVNIRTILNSSWVNISTISYPNSTIAISNQVMSKSGQTFTYNFCNTSLLGTYVYDYFDSNGDVYVNDFSISYNGIELDVQKSVLYLGLLAVLTFLFLLIIFSYGKLPKGDSTNDDNLVVSINRLKYLRPICLAVSWGLLLGIIFIASNISIAYLPTSLFGQFFFMIYKIMLAMSLPMVFIWLIYIFAKIWQDVEVKRLIERGVEVRGKL